MSSALPQEFQNGYDTVRGAGTLCPVVNAERFPLGDLGVLEGPPDHRNTQNQPNKTGAHIRRETGAPAEDYSVAIFERIGIVSLKFLPSLFHCSAKFRKNLSVVGPFLQGALTTYSL